MNNQEIINKLSEIDKLDNLCDKIISLKTFEADYKKSEFFKTTKLDIMSLYHEYHKDNSYNLVNVFEKLQGKIDDLDLSHFTELINQFTNQEQIQVNELKDALSNTTQLAKSWSKK